MLLFLVGICDQLLYKNPQKCLVLEIEKGKLKLDMMPILKLDKFRLWSIKYFSRGKEVFKKD